MGLTRTDYEKLGRFPKGWHATLFDALWARVERGKATDCWLWTGARGCQMGYGSLTFHAKRYYAHRVAYEFANGPIPAGSSVLHTCDNPICVNPAHLFLGDHKINAADMVRKGRETTPSAKLSPEQVVSIWRAVQRGERLAVLARQYAVTSGCIYGIKVGKRWRKLTANLRTDNPKGLEVFQC